MGEAHRDGRRGTRESGGLSRLRGTPAPGKMGETGDDPVPGLAGQGSDPPAPASLAAQNIGLGRAPARIEVRHYSPMTMGVRP